MSESKANELSRVVVRIHAGVLAVVFAIIGGAGLFLTTVWLLIKGGPKPGPHLSLLSQYLIGYSVTWPGSIVGFLYGALIGGIVGWMVAVVYNSVARARQR